jgi:TolA-binding protein
VERFPVVVSLHRYCPILLFSALLFAQPLTGQALDLNRALSDGMSAYKAKNYQGAVDNLSAIVKASPEGAIENVLYTLGFSYYFLLRHQEAAETFQGYLKKFPQSKNVTEVHLCIGRSLLQLEGKAKQALGHLAEAMKNPEFAEEARFLAAEAYIKAGDTEKAAATLQAAIRANASGPSVLRASLNLIDLYIGEGQFDKAVAMLKQLEQSPGYADVIVTVNHRFVQIGDRHLEAKAYRDALTAYSSVRPRAQVIAIQTARLEDMRRLKDDYDKRIAAAIKAKQDLPRGAEDKAAMLGAMIENTDKILGEVRTLDDYDSLLQYRIGRCYFNMERYWPASVAFEILSAEFPESPDSATALFGAIICQWKLGRGDATRALCESYLKRFPEGKHLAQVAELNATLLLQQGHNDKAITFIDQYLAKNKESELREKFLFLLANARFQGGKYNEAAKDYDALRKEFASSPDFEEFTYRRALCDFLRNDYKATIKSFDAYERDFPRGQFIGDVRYRRGIILLALKEYDKLIASMNALLKDSGSQGYAGQIHTLLGDAYTAKADGMTAADHYAAAVRNANRDENVIQYSLEQATNLLRSNRRFAELQALWKDFLAQNPQHPQALRGVAELAKLLVRDKKQDEARKMLAEHALREIHNTRSDYVEMLISQLAGLFVPPRSFKKDTPPPDIDAIEKELVKSLAVPEESRSVAYLARVSFAKAELARMMRDPARNELHLNSIAAAAAPDDLGPVLLSILGQFLIDTKQLDKAVPYFTRLRDAFPTSPFSDAAPVGLGDIALERKDYAAAVQEFDYALTRSAGGSMIKEATFGKALALFHLKKHDEAKKLLEEIVAAKDWRGVEKAGALFYLGEIAAEKGDKGAANAYFQRVFLSHGAFPQFAAKAYIRSAEMLKADGQDEAATKTYRQLVNNPKYAETEEVKIARERLGE